MLVAVRDVGRGRIITEPECRRARLSDRPAARVRTDAPWRNRRRRCRCGRPSHRLNWWWNVGLAQAREWHGIRKRRDGPRTRDTRRTWRAAGADRRWPCRQVETMRLSDDGILRDAHPPADLCCRVPLRPEVPQRADRAARPFEFGVCATHPGLLLLFHRKPASWLADGAPGKARKRPAVPCMTRIPRGTIVAAGSTCTGQLRASPAKTLLAGGLRATRVNVRCVQAARDESRAEALSSTADTLSLQVPCKRQSPALGLSFASTTRFLETGHGTISTISPNGIVRLRVGVSQMTGRPGSCGWSLQSRSVA
jgi:hypothetical protein